MFAIGYLQEPDSNAGWITFLVLGFFFVMVVVGWLVSRGRGERAEAPPEARVHPEEARPTDDLTRIEGIGPKVAEVLNKAGIKTFDGLARADAGEVQKLLDEAGLQMMSPEGWIEQAKLAAKGDWDGFERLQGELKGGRKT